MTDILQQIWFPIAAMLAVLIGFIFALKQRSRQKRRAEMHDRPIVVMAPDAHRDENRLN